MRIKKIFSIALCLVLLTANGAVIASAQTISQAFKPVGTAAAGDYVLINNESVDSYDYQSTGTITSQSIQASLNNKDVEGIYKIDLNREIPEVLRNIDKSDINYNIKVQEAYAVGASRKFWVVDDTTSEFYQIAAKLLYSGTKSEVWVADNKITSDMAKKMGQEFDNKMYPSVANNFSAPGDIDNNGKINLLCYDIKDGYNGYGGYISGYFYGLDLCPESVVQSQVGKDYHSNQGEILYIDTYPSMYYGGSAVDSSAAYSTIVHEFQHLVNTYRNVFVEGKGQMPTWISEGLADAAEQVYSGKVDQSRIDYYNVSSSIADGHSLTVWDNWDPLSNYSLSYLFFQYLKIQSGQGNAIFKEMITNKENDEIAVENIIKKYINKNMTLGQFTTSFRMALIKKDKTGLYGFKGQAEFDKIKTNVRTRLDTPFELNAAESIVIETGDDYAVSIPADKGKDIKYLGTYDTYAREDINRDGKINMTDISAVASKYNTQTTKSNWFQDPSRDGIFDIYDFVRIAKKIN